MDTGPHAPKASGSYPSASGARARASSPVEPVEVPLGYVVASAVLLAIALVGFGLWIAFEVI